LYGRKSLAEAGERVAVAREPAGSQASDPLIKLGSCMLALGRSSTTEAPSPVVASDLRGATELDEGRADAEEATP
jgi:hypothetical protein